MPEWLKIILLGLVEGVTEFLPISSTGHLIIAASLLDLHSNISDTFVIFIQLGAVVAVVFFYRHQLLKQFRALPHDRGTQRLVGSVFVAFVPVALVGLTVPLWLRDALFTAEMIGVSLIFGGILFLFVEWGRPHDVSVTHDLSAISIPQALVIGLAQVLAIAPGMSRSGMSMVGGRLVGLDRSTAAEFSFYLAIPTLGAATLFELATNLYRIEPDELGYLLFGAAVSAVVAWMSIGWLLRYVSRHSFVPFGWYRIGAGLVILMLAAGR